MLNNKIEIRLIVYGSEEYMRELELRDEVLRKPIGLSIFDDHLEKETKDYHIGAFRNEVLVGILILTDINNDQIKVRQVAVDELFRGKHIGTKLTIYAEDLAKRLDYKRIILNARKTAVEFYEKLGYLKEGDEFLEVGIPHFRMHRPLD
ncbi:MAG TPA: GNAT family N-acetyltransferase [Clostridia bacterium]|nr:GNAT family N-acetyltransferase [Clostridia bacterium]